MSVPKSVIYDVARDFVLEYLQRTPEFIDVVEFVDDAIVYEDDEQEGIYTTVFDAVVGYLDTVAQRLEGEDD